MLLFSIDTNDADQRLDKFLRKLMPNASLSEIYKMNRTGKVKVNGKKEKDNARLLEGDEVRIFLPTDVWEVYQRHVQKNTSSVGRIDLRKYILFEDAECIILNKPAGINVHPGDHKTHEISLIEQVNDVFADTSSSHTFRPSLVHRIDRETSGAIIIARTKQALVGFLDALQSGKIQKTYHAIVVGIPEKKRDTIRKRLTRIEGARDEAKVKIDPEKGQEAITHYRVLQEFERYALLECQIETGRTHQIRVHLASLGTPIVGDKLYGSRTENAFAKKYYDIHRHLLHARELAFTHPITRKSLTISAPYPEDFQGFLDTLQHEKKTIKK